MEKWKLKLMTITPPPPNQNTTVLTEKSLLGQLLRNKAEDSKTYEDINQGTSEKKMKCFGA